MVEASTPRSGGSPPPCAATESPWYRYEDEPDEYGAHLRLRTFPILSTTPKGVWLYGTGNYAVFGDRRFVRRDARKRWACPTVGEAAESFAERKRRQIRILRARLHQAEVALGLIRDGRERSTWQDELELIE